MTLSFRAVTSYGGIALVVRYLKIQPWQPATLILTSL